MSIFVSIASYRDEELQATVDSIVNNADDPKNLHLSIYQQCLAKEHIFFESQGLPCKVTNRWLNARDARGAGFARAQAQQAFNDEEYYFQVDSHTRVIKGWDTKLIKMLKKAQTLAGQDKIILSQFPAPYEKANDGSDIFMEDHPKYTHKPTKQKLMLASGRSWSAERVPLVGNDPEESETVLAGFVFAPGTIVKEVPYDPDISFFGEELCFAIRAWTRGWQIYSPSEMYVWHFYKRANHHKIWDSRNDAGKKWKKIEKFSMLKQGKIYNSEKFGIYGVQSAQKFSDYEKFTGVEINKIYQDILKNRVKISKDQLEQDMIFTATGVTTQRLSIPCQDGDHEGTEVPCNTEGCECECHSTPG